MTGAPTRKRVESRALHALRNDVEGQRARVVRDDGQADAVDRDGVAVGDALGNGAGRLDDEPHPARGVAASRADAAEVRDEAAKHAAAVRSA